MISSDTTLQRLQALSDLCVDLRLLPSTPHAAVFSDSVLRNVVLPLRRTLVSKTEYLPQVSLDDTSYEHRETVQTLLSVTRQALSANDSSTFITYPRLLDFLLLKLHHTTHEQHTFNALTAVWSDLLSILRAHIHRWVFHTVVHDPFHTFFITTSASSPKAEIIQDDLPQMLPVQLANMIVFVGNASKCTKLLSANTDACNQMDINLDAVFDKLAKQPLSASLILESAMQSWRERAAHHLSSILPFSQIASRIHSLRAYLLHGAASFWRAVFDDIRTNPQLSKFHSGSPPDDRTSAEKALNRLLSAVAAEVHARVDNTSPPDPPFSLNVSEDGAVYPHFVLSFAEGQVLSSRAAVYCDVFSVTFASRRTTCELRTAFMHLQLVERLLGPRARGICTGFKKGRPDLSRRARTRHLVGVTELRRRMMCFVEAVEWHLQAEVLQPRFDKLLNLFDSQLSSLQAHDEGVFSPRSSHKGLHGRSLFDAVTETHNEMMDTFIKECFIADDALNVRLHTIFSVCVSFCDFVRSLSPTSVLSPSFTQTMSVLDQEFCRNVELFVQMLFIQETKGNSKISSLLLRLNYNSGIGVFVDPS